MFRYTRFAAILAVCLLCAACLPNRSFRVGPYPFVFDVGAGEFDPEGLPILRGLSGTVEHSVSLCDIFGGVDVDALVEANIDDDIAPFFTLSEVIMTRLTILATQGNFDSVTNVELYFISEVPGEAPVLLSEVSSANGFDMEIVLEPEFEIDLLPVIRDIEANPDGPCPELLFVVQGDSDFDAVQWQAQAFADIYGELGI